MRAWIAGLIVGVASAAAAEPLAPGVRAPAFSLPGSDGGTHSLAEHAGERGVVLAWFPKAFTPGCTKELAALRDSAEQLAAFDVAVYMVSFDEPARNRDFAESLGARLVLLSDASGDTARAYGVAGPGALFAKRWTFYIDPDGVIREIDKDVDVSRAGRDIARNLERLGFPRSDRADP